MTTNQNATPVLEHLETIKKHPEIQKNLRRLSQLKTWRSLLAFAFDWSVIVAAAVFTEAHFSPVLYVGAVFIIASRQHALLTLMHEAAHQRLSARLWFNDFMGDYFSALPLLAGTPEYRKHHLQHHRALNSDQDPDWARKIHQPIWQFPRAKRLIAKDFAKMLYLGGLEWLMIARYFSKPRTGRFVFWALALGAVTATDAWIPILTYWFVPMLTVFPAIQRVRSIAEHFGLPRTTDLDSSRNVIAPAAELFFFGPHNVNYHLDHHLFPSVPFYHLKDLNRTLMKIPVYAEGAHQNSSYLIGNEKSVLTDLTAAEAIERTEAA